MRRRLLVLCVVLALGLTLLGTPIASAQTGFGDTLVIEEGERVDSVSGVWATVVIHGTVTGDVSASAGRVEIHGTVNGNVNVGSGSLEITGTVDGDVNAGAGSITIGDTARIGGSFSGGAGTIAIAGSINGTATVGAETIRLGENASIAGDLRYDGTLEGNREAVEGTIKRDRSTGPDFGVAPWGSWLVGAYILGLNLLIGGMLLWLLPGLSAQVSERVRTEPLSTGLFGVAALILAPILLVLLGLTIIGIPLAILGALLFALIVWIGLIYGRFAVAAWLLYQIDSTNRWLALVVGLVGGALLAEVPYLGWAFSLVFLLLGLGALTQAIVNRRRAEGTSGE